MSVDKDGSWSEGAEVLKEILENLSVPAFSIIDSSLQLVDMSVLEMMGTSLCPFLSASHGDLRRAATRLVKTCSWRCMILLPMIQSVDEEAWRTPNNIAFMKSHGLNMISDQKIQETILELKAGRFFHEGYDEQGDPIVYFIIDPSSNMNLNIDAIENAALYVIERALQNASSSKQSNESSWTRCTLIIILEGTKLSYWDSLAFYPLRYLPLIQRMVPLFSLHYPERLKNVLIVSTSSKMSLTGTQSWWGNVLGNVGAFAFVPSATTRRKIHVISKLSDLSKYISLDSLKQLKCLGLKDS